MTQYDKTEIKEKKVLVVDDDANITQLLKEILEKSGRFRVRVVNNALHAIDTAREFKPDVILIDIIMPEMNGYEIVERIKDEIDFMHTHFIFLSRLVTKKETGTTGKCIGGKMFLSKPIMDNNVITCIDNIFGETMVTH